MNMSTKRMLKVLLTDWLIVEWLVFLSLFSMDDLCNINLKFKLNCKCGKMDRPSVKN